MDFEMPGVGEHLVEFLGSNSALPGFSQRSSSSSSESDSDSSDSSDSSSGSSIWETDFGWLPLLEEPGLSYVGLYRLAVWVFVSWLRLFSLPIFFVQKYRL